MSQHTNTHASKLRGRRSRVLLSLPALIAALGIAVPAAFGAMPDDPSFSLQWAENNTGQSVPTQESEELLGPPAPGTPGDDADVLKAWQVNTGSRSIVIGETDTGVDYQHPDVAANIWSNPGGIGGCPAGTRGYNALAHSCDPMDTDTAYGGHGTHVAGIMGAVGNNGTGVAGVNWQSTILPVKWLQAANKETGALVEALQWLVKAKQEGVNLRVVNDSPTFLGTLPSSALKQEIETLGANNILFVTAAGNTGDDDDTEAVRRYPCGYDLPNEICVTASNDKDELPSWANYGPHTVNLAAPGVSIYSTLRENKYNYLSGGSMASAQVAGAAALILSVKPSLSATELKADILDNVAPEPTLSGKVITGGILDICKALPSCEEPPPSPPPNPNTPPSPPPPNPVTPSSTSAANSAAPVTTTSSVTAVVSTGSASTVITTIARLPVHHGSVAAKLRCTGPQACAGKLELTVRTRIKVKARASTRKQTIGIATFSIPSGKTVTVTIALNAIGRALWRAAQGHLSASLALFQSSPAPARAHTQNVVLDGGRPVVRRTSPR